MSDAVGSCGSLDMMESTLGDCGGTGGSVWWWGGGHRPEQEKKFYLLLSIKGEKETYVVC